MEVIAVLQWFMFIPVNMSIVLWNIHRNLTIKKKFKIWGYIFPPLFLTIESIVYLLDMYLYNAVVKVILNAFIIAHFMISYQERLSKKIFIYSVTYILIALAEAITHFMCIIMDIGIIYPTDIGITQLIVLTFNNFLCFVILSLFTYIYNRKKENKHDDGYLKFALVPFSQLFLGEALFVNYNKGDIRQETIGIFAAGIIIAIIADIFLFIAIRSMREAERNKIKIAKSEYNQKLAHTYYQNIQNNIEQTMKYRHDFNNMISTVQTLINTGNQSESIDFLNEMKEKNEATQLPVYCQNPIVNSIIYDKKQLAESKLINFRVSVNITENLNIDLTDICSIFTNLIDNAFNSASESENKTVELDVWCELGYLFVRTVNYPDTIKEISHQKKHSFTDLHGYGLHILSDITEKYDGCFNIDTSENKFMAVCSLRY